MNYTKSKEDLLIDIRNNVMSELNRNISNIHNSSMSSMGYTLQQGITDAVVTAFRTLIENTYTDQQFEQDLKLKS